MIYDVLRFAADKVEEGEKVALVTLTEKTAGAPGAAGQMMAVLKDGTTKGTIGGGTAEYNVIEQSKQAIMENRSTFQFAYDLNETKMICGGSIKGFGNVLGFGARLILFGGGHVACSIYPVAKSLGFHVIVVDEREELATSFEGAQYLTYSPSEAGERIIYDKETYIVICTRGHVSDYESLCACIDKPSAYLGMIGSVKKVDSIFSKMEQNGYQKEELERIYAPIGLDISDGTPNEIAISVMSEILQVKNGGTLMHMRERRKK